MTAVADGQSDFFNSKVPAEIQKLSENPAWKKTPVDTLFYYYLVFNLKGNDTRPANKALQDPKVREAIYYAIDRETLAKNLYGEIGEVAALGVPARDTANYNDKINTFKYEQIFISFVTFTKEFQTIFSFRQIGQIRRIRLLVINGLQLFFVRFCYQNIEVCQ